MGNERAVARTEAKAAQQHGAVARRQALAFGVTDKTIGRLLRSGRWLHAEPGVYVVAGSPKTFERAVTVALLGERDGAVASHLAAGALHGVVTREPARIDVTVPRPGHTGRRSGKLVHRALSLGPADVRRVAGIPVTGPARTLVDLAGVLDKGRLEHALDTAVNRGLVSIASLERYISQRNLGRLKGMGVLHALIEDRKSGVLGSGLERAFRRIVRDHGLPVPERQHRADGRRLDFAYPDFRVYVEIDGDAAHASAAALRSDLRRQNELVLTGWDLPLRYTESCIYNDSDRVCRELETALLARGWIPPGRTSGAHSRPLVS